MLIYSLSNILHPYFYKLIIDDAINNNRADKLIYYTLFMLITISVVIVSRYLQSIIFLRLGQKICFKLRNDIIDRLSKYSNEFVREYKTGEIVSILENDAMVIQRLATNIISNLLINTITAIGLSVILFQLNYFIAIISLCLAVIYTLFQRKYGSQMREESHKFSMSRGEIQSASQELITNLSKIKMLNGIGYFQGKYNDNQYTHFGNQFSVLKTREKSNIISGIFQGIGLAIVLCLGGYFVINDSMTMGALFAVTLYLQKIYAPIVSISTDYIEVKKSQASIDRILNILENDKYMMSDGQIGNKEIPNDCIKFENLSFGFSDVNILEDINVIIRPGEKVALLGDNGSGKTTLIRLLVKLQERYKGKISIGNYDIKTCKNQYLRKHIICVDQESFIFNGTILENILMGREGILDEEMNKILGFVCLKDDIKGMQEGINTVVGDKGVKLSGGQAQKIALARIYINNPSIIVLDEPTSALDLQSEEKICENLFRYFESKTIIVITHRKKVLNYCNRVLNIRDKKIL